MLDSTREQLNFFFDEKSPMPRTNHTTIESESLDCNRYQHFKKYLRPKSMGVMLYSLSMLSIPPV
jgi:hypothetical protein